MRRARLGISVLLAAALSAILAGCGDGSTGSFAPNREGTLTVLTQPLPTLGFWEGEGQRATGGVEYELAAELADRLGLDDLAVRTAPFSEIVAGELGDADVAMALITPTAERDEVLDFSSPYFDAAPALLARAGTEIPDVQTAQELTWALGKNTTFEAIVPEAIRPDAEPLTFEDRSEELDAVRDGTADVAMYDLPAALAIEESDPELEVVAKLASTEPIAVALPDGSGNVEAVSAAIRAIVADGTLEEITERWLGRGIVAAEGEVSLLRTSEP